MSIKDTRMDACLTDTWKDTGLQEAACQLYCNRALNRNASEHPGEGRLANIAH